MTKASYSTYWKRPKHAMWILKRAGKKKMPTSLNSHDEFLLTLMRLQLGLLNEPCRSLRYITHKILIHFYNLDKIIGQAVKKSSCLKICLKHLLKLRIINVESFYIVQKLLLKDQNHCIVKLQPGLIKNTIIL